jgi:hypothetical protein
LNIYEISLVFVYKLLSYLHIPRLEENYCTMADANLQRSSSPSPSFKAKSGQLMQNPFLLGVALVGAKHYHILSISEADAI